MKLSDVIKKLEAMLHYDKLLGSNSIALGRKEIKTLLEALKSSKEEK